MQKTQLAQMQHHFRYAASHKGPYGWVINRAIGQYADQARHLFIYAYPVLHRRNMAARLMRNRRNVQQEIGGAAECRVDHHGVFNRAIGEDILRRDALLAQQQRGPR